MIDISDLRKAQSSGVKNIKDTLKTIEINLIDFCNRSCSFCPHGIDEYTHPQGKASIKLFHTLKDQIIKAKWSNRISLCGFGEPTLHKQLLQFINILNDTGCWIELTTNGDLLNKNYIQDLINTKISLINVSVYDIESLNQLQKVFDGIDKTKYILRNRFSIDNDYVDRSGVIKSNIKKSKNACYLPSYKMLLNHSGDVFLCCNDWSRKNKYGNIFKKNIFDIWINGMKTKRSDLINGKRTGVCKSCDVSGTRYGKDSVDYFKKEYNVK